MKTRFLRSPLGGAVAVCAVTAAHAQPAADSDGDTIIVEGKRAYIGDFAPNETPQANQTIDQQALRDAGVLDIDQALDLSASVARQNNFGGLWNSFAIRGFVGDGNLPSNYLVNGFNAGRGFGGPRDISGIEAVEVLKGPRAALFGRGEPGGAVNLVTKRPSFERAGELRLSAGSFETYRAEADWTGPVTDNIAVRLIGFYEDAESFRDTIETRRHGASPSVAATLGDKTRLVYELEYSHQEIPFDRGVVAVDGELGVIPIETFLGEPGDGPLEADVLGHQAELLHDFNDDWSVLVGFNYRDTSLEGFSTEAELSASRQLLFADGETLTRQRRFRDYDAVYRVFRAELSGDFETGPFRHRLIFGADADKFENDQVFMRARAPSLASNPTLEQLQAINIFNPVYGQYELPAPGPLTDRVETQKSLGIYLQDQISLTDRLDIRIGARYDDYEQELVNRLSDSVSGQSESRLSPQFGVVYEASDQISFYASYGENFRPLSGATFSGEGFDPNTSMSVEAGVKFQLNDGRLAGTLTVFSVQQDNILVGDPANAFFLIAAGEAESKGVEFDLSGEIADGLSAWLSYAYVDAEMSNDALDPDFNLPIEAGDRLLNIPAHQLNAQLAKQWRVASRPLTVGGGLLYVGERLGEVATDFELPGYALVRAFADYELNERLMIRGEINNLFDKEYYANSYSALWVQPGAPRNYRISAAFSF